MKLLNYEHKYIKYKSKYLENKKIIQKGGMDCKNDRTFKNILGTCWMIVIQMMICFGDATKNDIEVILNINKYYIDTYLKELIQAKKSEIEDFFQKSFIQDENKESLLFNILKTFYIRYSSKVGNIKDFLIKPIEKENPLRCELIINNNFKELFTFYLEIVNRSINVSGGDLIQQFYFANILGIFFLNNKIYFKNFTKNNYTKINFDPKKDIGLILYIHAHVCCCFICNNVYKFYNDNDRKIYDCDWYNLLLNLNVNEDLFIVSNGIVKLDRNEYFENIEYYYLDYIRIQYISIVSKNNFEDELNKQISMYVNHNYDKISDFYLLYKIYRKTENNIYLINSANKGFHFSQYILGKNNNNLKELENAVNNGSLSASYELAIKKKELNNFEDSEKYFLIAYNKMFFYENDVIKNDIAKNLYEIYYNHYNNYKVAAKFKLIYLEVEAIRELKKLEDFNEKKILADKGFFDLQFDIGKVYLEKKDITNAILYFDLAFESKQYYLKANAAYQLGKIYQKEDIEKTIDYYTIASYSKKKLFSGTVLLELGQIYLDKGDLFQAIFFLKSVIEKNINSLTDKAALKLSEILINQNKKKEAIYYLKLAAEKGSDDIAAKSALKLSEILIDKNEVIIYLKLAVEKGSADISAESALKLSEILIKKKEDNEAIIYLKVATEKGTTDKTAITALKLGEIYEVNKNYKDAVKYLKKAIELKINNFDAALLLYKIYRDYYKNYRLAWYYKLMIVPTYKKNIEKLEDFCELKNLADKGFFDLQYEVGNKYLNEGNEIEALKYLNKAMNTNQNDLLAKVALKLGEILINQKKENEAIYYINLATKEGIDDIQALAFFKLGEINEKKNIDEAIVNYSDVIYSLNYNEKYYDIIVKTALKLGKIYFDKNEFMDAKYWLIEGINKGTDDTIVEHASILVDILKKEKKNYNDASAYLNRNIDVSKIRILLNKLDNIYKPKL